MSRKSAARNSSRAAETVAESNTLYEDIESAWLEPRPDLDMAMACTLLRLERVNQLHEMRVQEISNKVDLNTGDLHVLLALRRSGKPYELRPTDLFRNLLITSGAVAADYRGQKERQARVVEVRGLRRFRPAEVEPSRTIPSAMEGSDRSSLRS